MRERTHSPNAWSSCVPGPALMSPTRAAGARLYLVTLVESAALRPRDYVLELDGEQVSAEAFLVAVGNGQTHGGGMWICPCSSTG